MKYIDYRDLPCQTNLFLDYVYDFEKVAKFYTCNFRSDDELLNYLKTYNLDKMSRVGLCEGLMSQNNHDTEAVRNIKLLAEPKTFVIVTGQQLGFMGGPLYTIYKIFTTIKLVDLMSDKFPDYNFVPLFWMESEDHDFNEINKVKIFDKTNSFCTHEYCPIGYTPETNLGATGKIILDSEINTFNNNILNTIQITEYAPIIQNLLSIYSEGKSNEECFIDFISEFVRGTGLIFLNPNSIEIKRLLKPIFEKELLEFPKTSEFIINISAKLEEIYHAQVKARPINLFYHHQKGRFLIEPNGTDYALKGIRQKFSKPEIIETLNTTPEVFSPNVILRPICQDFILPTFMYVAGPSEIAYFAQINSVYNYFGMRMPIIYPRASVTLLENKIQNLLTKFNLGLTELSVNYTGVQKRITDSMSDIKIEEEFEKAILELNNVFANLENITKQIDVTLISNLKTTKEKIEHLFKVYEEKLYNSQKRNHAVALEQLEKVKSNIFPKGNLQERELNLIYYLNKYSSSITDKIYHELDITCFQHQLIRL
jgi:bacillithiol biosynthesis cysteine-adding enzyme BshC